MELLFTYSTSALRVACILFFVRKFARAVKCGILVDFCTISLPADLSASLDTYPKLLKLANHAPLTVTQIV